jgi:hypothetical protein
MSWTLWFKPGDLQKFSSIKVQSLCFPLLSYSRCLCLRMPIFATFRQTTMKFPVAAILLCITVRYEVNIISLSSNYYAKLGYNNVSILYRVANANIIDKMLLRQQNVLAALAYRTWRAFTREGMEVPIFILSNLSTFSGKKLLPRIFCRPR